MIGRGTFQSSGWCGRECNSKNLLQFEIFLGTLSVTLKMLSKMGNQPFKLIIVALLLYMVSSANTYMIGSNPYHRVETLEPGKYELEWLVDWDSKIITFNVTAQTKGYVGFGISGNGKMEGSDIVVGGLFPNGTSYFSDRHSEGYEIPTLDEKQDYELHSVTENDTHTFLSFSRKLDTCDNNDHPITNDGHVIIWAYGDKDGEIAYHYKNRGAYNVALLQPDYSPSIEIDSTTGNVIVNGKIDPELHVWAVPRNMVAPENDTSYWCTMHKLPVLSRKHHLVGFNVRYGSVESQRHVHHIQINKCHAPQGTNAKELFSPFLGHRGQNCYNFPIRTGPLPTDHCQEIFLGAAFAGRMLYFPPHIGIPIGENPDEFYVVQVHYDNPAVRSDLVVNLTVEFYYTEKLRLHEGGFMAIGHIFPGTALSILVPPSSTGHLIRGHCSPHCTGGIVPKEGINLYAFLLHGHNAAKKIKLQHFRNNKELANIAKDDNYLFSYQPFRAVQKEVKILPGDHLVTSCEYGNTLTNTTTVGGFSAAQEMCVTMTLYYNKIADYSGCASQINSDDQRFHFLGVKNVTWQDWRKEYVVEAPEHLAGKTISEVSDSINWTPELREELQRFHLTYPHESICLRHKELSHPNDTDYMTIPSQIAYPDDAEKLQPEKMCN